MVGIDDLDQGVGSCGHLLFLLPRRPRFWTGKNNTGECYPYLRSSLKLIGVYDDEDI